MEYPQKLFETLLLEHKEHNNYISGLGKVCLLGCLYYALSKKKSSKGLHYYQYK